MEAMSLRGCLLTFDTLHMGREFPAHSILQPGKGSAEHLLVWHGIGGHVHGYGYGHVHGHGYHYIPRTHWRMVL